MKKLVLLLFAFCLSSVLYAQNPPSVVIEDGITSVRILTVPEYISVGGQIEGQACAPAAGKSKKSGSTLACPKGNGCCWSSVVESTPSGGLGMITLLAQANEEGEVIPETHGLYAFYNAEIDRIIFR